MKKMIKYFILIIALVLVISMPNLKAGYNYDPNGNVVSSAESLVVTHVIDSSNLSDVNGNKVDSSTYSFGALYDVATFNDLIYTVDYTNNCVVVLNSDYQYVRKFPELSDYQAEFDAASDDEKVLLENKYTLKNPRGIYVTDEGIYVCDYGKGRIVIFDHNYKYVREVGTPNDPAFENYEFKPKKITVDRTGRMFVIAEGVNEGILDLEPSGEFSRFFGTNTVTLSAWDAFWLIFTSEEQREIQGFNFGASLANLCIDSDNNVYTVSSIAAGAEVIKKLNPKGSDILNRNGYVQQNGDSVLNIQDAEVTSWKTSNFVDIDVNEYGTYIALDNVRGRIFAYDFEGSLLYTAGSKADLLPGSYQTGMFLAPEALTYFGDSILVCDSKNQNIVVFEYTTFGNLVNKATELYYDDKYIEAAEVWEEVLALNTNYYIAYAGIGKAQLRQGDYHNAMENLKLGFDEYNYSRAYQQIRYEQMNKVFPYVISAVMILVIFGFVKSIIKNAKQDQREEEGY